MAGKHSQDTVNKLYESMLSRTGKLHVSEISQRLRYDSVLRHVDFDDKIVLEVGCGTGDFAQVLLKETKLHSYHGLDILKPALERAKERFDGHANFTFSHNVNYAGGPRSHSCHVAVALGVFDAKFDEHEERNLDRVMSFVRRMYDDASECVVFTFATTNFEGTPQEHQALLDPCRIYTLLRRMSWRVLLDDTYAPHLMTAVMFHGLSPWKELSSREVLVSEAPAAAKGRTTVGATP